jgi:preprotein translocase subunit SecA
VNQPASLTARVRERIDHWRGGHAIVTGVAPYRRKLDDIDNRADGLAQAGDDELRERSTALRARAQRGADLGELEANAFALVREASGRTIGLRPFDVQLLAALAMHGGHVVEMQTGEGKTLAAVFAAYLNALPGRGVHVLTFNDYLARRDAAWMGPLYRFLGLSVEAVQEGMSPDQRRRAYAADVTYVTAKEAGFDLLRDALCYDADELVQRPFHFALVDEADSLLIDEARVPLVIAGSESRSQGSTYRMAELVRRLEPGVHYEIDEHGRSVDLTESGMACAEQLLDCGDLLANENLGSLTELNCALHAAVLLRRDVDYILRGDKIRLVDEFTGRVVEDRHWPDGLQSALEAKEGLELRPEGRILGSITLQHFLQLYPALCGMTGTARPAAEEIREFYGLDVVVIPPNRPCVRRDLPDVVFTHRQAKLQAVVDEVRRVHRLGRPVLVGTLSVAESERLGQALGEAAIDCAVLNAKNDEREARIVAGAGAPGAVTISTNMAGRGTDIRLGGAQEEERDRVVRLGGLYVIGTNRHESVRIDQQLRGRSGRQGDPGSTRFYISLEDELIVRYGIERLVPARLWPAKQEGPLESPLIAREIARAQRIIDGQNHDIRRTLCRYSERIEVQRKALYGLRREILLDRAPPRRFARVDPQRYAEACARAGEDAVDLAEKQATLFYIDHGWHEHLAVIADLREGIHLLRVGGQDPLTEFVRLASESFREIQARVDENVSSTLRNATITERGIDLHGAGLRGPSSTRTYLINDDPFRDQLAIQLAGGTGFAAAAALYTGPILILWGLYNRFLRKPDGRRHPQL